MILSNLGSFVLFIIKEAIFVTKSLCYLHVTNTYLIMLVQTLGPSMLPTIDLTRSEFLAENISTRFGKIAPGDIVVLRNPQHPRRFMIKRMVGLEGDSVTYITNLETDGLEGDSYRYISNHENSGKPNKIVVPKGSVWVEGDNKYNNNNSRKFGPVSYDLIQGKIFWRITPLKDIGPFWNK